MAVFGEPYGGYSSASGLGEVVGPAPYEDGSDATYVRATSRESLPAQAGDGFAHINCDVLPGAGGEALANGVVRASATVVSGTATIARMVANLYGPGDIYMADGAVLNFVAGSNPVYVEVPADGQIHDIAVSLYDWVTETPATTTQVADYFATGGTLSLQASYVAGVGDTGAVHQVDIRIYEISAMAVAEISGQEGGTRRRFVRSS